MSHGQFTVVIFKIVMHITQTYSHTHTHIYIQLKILTEHYEAYLATDHLPTPEECLPMPVNDAHYSVYMIQPDTSPLPR